jgi:hypothetical protein
MRNRSFATLGVLALLATASAFGQSRLRYDIPFEFHFLNTVMPAGQYDVNAAFNGLQNVLSVECSACRAHGYTVTYGIGGGGNPSYEGRLVFHKYGDTYYLSEVWTPGNAQGGALAKSKTEREIARATPDMAHITLAARKSHVAIAQR